MNISDTTLSILQNFSTINNGIQIHMGNVIRTLSPNKTVLATAKVEEEFTIPFCIYDLTQFLGTLSLFDAPDLVFKENHLIITENSTRLKYVYADPSTIVTVPDKALICDGVVQFDLTAKVLGQVMKAASVLALPNLTFASEGNSIVIAADDVKNSSSNVFRIEVPVEGEEELPNFVAALKIENLKLMNDPYTVDIDPKGFIRFQGPRVEYFVAIEKNDSRF